MDARLIIDGLADGRWNMAVDELLFVRSIQERTATLRCYGWSPATLSLGYFQQAAARESHAPSRSLTLVRRTTGGGAIVHDQELTYSLVLPLQEDRPHVARNLVSKVHGILRDLFVAWGAAVRCCKPGEGRGDGENPFLCFQRRTADDLVLEGYKVVGSAQRRQHATLLQHGSILVRQSSFAPELLGIEDLSPLVEVRESLLLEWPQRLAKACDLVLTPGELTPSERAGASQIATEKYGAERWNAKR
ncbi:MAG: biotin/lipoate A/B protein ligase family protein [Pirellulaceae bacterium]